MDRHYTSVDEAQWARESAMQSASNYLSEKCSELEKQAAFLQQLCNICTDEQIAKVNGLSEFLAKKRDAEEKRQRTEKFMDEKMDELLAAEFNKLRR